MKTLVLLLALTVTACGVDQNAAETWVRKHFENVADLDCARFDSDDNGYVSCTIFFSDGRRPEPIECAASLSLQSGCRIATGAGGRRRR